MKFVLNLTVKKLLRMYVGLPAAINYPSPISNMIQAMFRSCKFLIKQIDEQLAILQEEFEKYSKTKLNPEERRLVDNFCYAERKYTETLATVKSLFLNSQEADALAIVAVDDARSAGASTSKILQELIQATNKTAQAIVFADLQRAKTTIRLFFK